MVDLRDRLRKRSLRFRRRSAMRPV